MNRARGRRKQGEQSSSTWLEKSLLFLLFKVIPKQEWENTIKNYEFDRAHPGMIWMYRIPTRDGSRKVIETTEKRYSRREKLLICIYKMLFRRPTYK